MTAHSLHDHQTRLKQWLFDKALPVWWEKGADLEKGGFYERLHLDTTPHDVNRRTRVAARQVYSYAQAQHMGYQGETERAIDQGLNWLSGPARNPETGMLYAVVSPQGEVVRSEFDFYDHAFALLAYASAFSVRKDKALEEAAVFIRNTLLRDYRHPQRGFEESHPRTLPLKANPHMHMFEACLAWIEAGGDETWKAIAAEIAELCVDKFLHPQTSALHEFFDGDWNRMAGEAGRIVEPGHQFEWAWLFLRWAEMTGEDRFRPLAHRLITIGEEHGTDHARGISFNEMWDDFSPKDTNARLWPQTERIKAAVRWAQSATGEEREAALRMAVAGVKGLWLYLPQDLNGLYRDRMKTDGSFEIESAPASTLYHIICAIDEFTRL